MPEFDRGFEDKRLVFLDLDGTIYLGEKLFPGAEAFLAFLKKKGILTYFLTNNSSRSKLDYVRKLGRLGIKVEEESIILSTDGVIAFLQEKNVRNVYTVGTKSMKSMFLREGMDPESAFPEYVVLGFDTELTYDKLKQASLHIQNGVKLLVTHPDLVCPSPEGFLPDAGSMLALMEKATGIKPARIFGKPNPEMVTHILKMHGVSPSEVVMIGDRVYTDMELARRLGCDFILVLSGETRPEDVPDLPSHPALIVPGIGRIIG